MSERRSLFAAQDFCWGSTVNRFLFLSTISSTSSDSEMSFDSEDSEIYYIAEENDDSHIAKLLFSRILRSRIDMVSYK